jgi:hypothetical protein
MKWRIIIIVLVAILVLAYIRTGLLGDCIGIASLVCYALLPFRRGRRVRARWASFSIVFSGLLGAAMSTLNLLRHSSLLVVSSETSHLIAHYRQAFWGLLLGVMLILMVSGQLFGTIREDEDENAA